MTTNVESTPSVTDPEARSARWAKRFGWWFYVTVMFVAPFVLVLAAVVGIFAWWKLADMKAAHEVKLEVARIQALGEPVTILDLYAWHRVPEGTNDTTALWLNALELAGKIRYTNTPYMELPIVGGGELETLVAGHPQSTLPLAEEFFRDNHGAIQAALIAAKARGSCRIPFQFERGLLGNSSTHSQGARAVARLMLLRSQVAIERGDEPAAVESLEANLALARAIDHQPSVIDQLVPVAIIEVTMPHIELLLNESQPEDELLARLQTSVQSLNIQESLTTALTGERGLGYQFFDQFPQLRDDRFGTAVQPMAGGTLTRQIDCRFYLERMKEYVDASRDPFPQALAKSEMIAAQVDSITESKNPLERSRYELSVEVLPPGDAAFYASARAEALRNLTLSAIAAKRYQLKHGKFPPDLEALSEFITTAPIDPYDGQPIRLIRKDGELVLYSIGQDTRDDRGLEQQDSNQPDIVVRLK